MQDIWTDLQYRIIRALAPPSSRLDEGSFEGKSKLRELAGDSILDEFRGKHIIEFGCGAGRQTVELALAGAGRVTGVDIQEDLLVSAREYAQAAGVADRCEFVTSTEKLADVIFTMDAFEHFTDPEAVLRKMRASLKPGGYVYVVFGYTWLHPLGGHLLSIFPWAHLMFSEKALMRWRATVRDDGATRICEVKGGLGKMTIGRFERLAASTGFRVENLELRPIRRAAWLHCRLTREFLTSGIRCRLVPV